MSLVGDQAKQIYGVVRNIMLQPVFFPTWTVRIYLEQPSERNQYRYPPIPSNVATKLSSLPVQLFYVTAKSRELDPSLWPILTIDDPSVNYLLVRKPTSRLSDRDAAMVHDWLDSGKALHVMRDHPDHCDSNIIAGLWGADTKQLREVVGGSIAPLLDDSLNETHFLNQVCYLNLKGQILSHDACTVLCSEDSIAFPVSRSEHHYLGQEFGPNGEFKPDKFTMPGDMKC